MLPDFSNPADWLPWAFASLMGLSILVYVVLDGFDLGVGILFPLAEPGGFCFGHMDQCSDLHERRNGG